MSDIVMTFCMQVAKEFGLQVSHVHSVVEREIKFATQGLKDPNMDFIREDILGRCKVWLEKGSYTPIMESDEELLFAVSTLRTAALFFGLLYEKRQKGKIIDGDGSA